MSAGWWAGCCVYLWVRQGTPEEGGQGGRPGGWAGSAEKGGRPEGPPGMEGQARGGGRGAAGAGLGEGEEKGGFKLLTLLVFFK